MIAASRTTYENIVLDEHGIPWIADANTKVAELAAEAAAHGWSPEEQTYQHPHLTLGQVHSAMAYYWAIEAKSTPIFGGGKCSSARSSPLPASTL